MDQVISEFQEDGTTLPLFIKPKNGQDSAEFLIQWIGSNKELLKQKIIEYGTWSSRWSFSCGVDILHCRCGNV